MAEMMASAIATSLGKKNDSSTPVIITPAETGSLEETPEAGADDSTLQAEAKKAMKREQRKALRDPAKVVVALREVVRVALANDLINTALAMVESAKKGNTIAMKILVDLCNIVNPDAGEDESGSGLTASELLTVDLEGKYLLESVNPATRNPAEPSIDVGIDSVFTGKTE